MQKIGLQTIKLDNPITIASTASIVGPKEANGPLAQYFAVKHGKVPIVGILLISLLLALILLNSFGIGTTVGSALEALAAAVIPIVVVGAIIVMIFKTLIHP